MKRYELDYQWKKKYRKLDLSIIEFEIDGMLIGFRECKKAEWVRYKDVKKEINRLRNIKKYKEQQK